VKSGTGESHFSVVHDLCMVSGSAAELPTSYAFLGIPPVHVAFIAH